MVRGDGVVGDLVENIVTMRTEEQEAQQRADRRAAVLIAAEYALDQGVGSARFIEIIDILGLHEDFQDLCSRQEEAS